MSKEIITNLEPTSFHVYSLGWIYELAKISDSEASSMMPLIYVNFLLVDLPHLWDWELVVSSKFLNYSWAVSIYCIVLYNKNSITAPWLQYKMAWPFFSDFSLLGGGS